MLLIIVAILEEARPIIQHYKLKSLQDNRYKIFKNEEIALIISGIGKINSAIATTYLSLMFPNCIKAFLNIGIAGHMNLPIGQIVSIYEISKNGKSNIFLSDLVEADIQKSLITVDVPQKDYESEKVYDMEGLGFVEAAQKFTYIDLIYCLKIISDNKMFKLEEIRKIFIEKLVLKNLEAINEFIIKIFEIKSKLKFETLQLPSFIKNLHLTCYEQNYVKELLYKIVALRKNFSFENFFDGCKDKKHAFRLLEDLYKKLHLML